VLLRVLQLMLAEFVKRNHIFVLFFECVVDSFTRAYGIPVAGLNEILNLAYDVVLGDQSW